MHRELNLKQAFQENAESVASVGIVVVTYNSNAHLLRLIASLKSQTIQDYELIVVDCASKPEELIYLKEIAAEFSFKLVLSPENRGFAGGNNIGLRIALAREYPFVWFLNADTSLENDSLELILFEAKLHSDYSAFGTKVLNRSKEGKTEVWSLGGYIKPDVKQVGMYTSESTMPKEVDYIPGCSMFFRAECLEQVGNMPEQYFMYFEETAWCQKIRAAGYRLKILPQVTVWHHFDDSKMNTAQNTYFYNRSYYRFWLENSSFGAGFSLISKVFFGNLLRSLKAYSKAPDADYRKLFKAHIYACLDFFTGRTKPRVF